MMKSLIVATAALALMAGTAMAQTSSSSMSTSTETTATPVAPSSVTIDKSSKVTSDRHGTTVEKTESGSSTTVGPAAPLGATETRRSTETTTVR